MFYVKLEEKRKNYYSNKYLFENKIKLRIILEKRTLNIRITHFFQIE